jgi:hypothetical protein
VAEVSFLLAVSLQPSGKSPTPKSPVIPNPRKRERNLLFAGSANAASESRFLDGKAVSE